MIDGGGTQLLGLLGRRRLHTDHESGGRMTQPDIGSRIGCAGHKLLETEHRAVHSALDGTSRTTS